MRMMKTVTSEFTRTALIASVFGFLTASAAAQDQSSGDGPLCSIDLTKTPMMRDILSNALMRGFRRSGTDVRRFLDKTGPKCASGHELLLAAGANFEISESELTAEVDRFRHCNCDHGPLIFVGGKLRKGEKSFYRGSNFAEDVILHVVLHELGHALIREFDLPVLSNEETMADAFATCYLTTHLPDRALDVIQARTTSLMIEASEVPRTSWTVQGEHNSDARRAWQIAALAVAADPEKYDSVGRCVGMLPDDIRDSIDYGAEIHRGWRRMLQPLWMPTGMDSNEGRVHIDRQSKGDVPLCSLKLRQQVEAIVQQFDWHSQVTIHFADDDGKASWSRSKRTITVNREYIDRFIRQGKTAVPAASD